MRSGVANSPSARSGVPLFLGARAGIGHSLQSEHLEAEANRIADLVTGNGPQVTENVTRSSQQAAGATAEPPAAVESTLRSAGRALDAATRVFMEPRFGADLSSVRIHDDAEAAKSARALSARAYTIGEHVVFGSGQYRPGNDAGHHLVAHELAHVMQARAGASAKVRRKEDWDFTPADYAKLSKGKGDLKIAADSSFVPSKLQDNILATLRYALDAKRKPAATAGVNLYDFYHGHLAVPNNDKGLSIDAIEARSRYKKEFTRQIVKTLGDEYAKVTTKNLKAYTKGIEVTLPLLGTAMEEGVKIKGAAVMYHTYETTAAELGIDPQDPRRNILTPLDTNRPKPYKVPKGKSDWTDEYINYLEFTFLVDQNGEVHVRPGTIAPLSTVIGRPAPNQ
jgi:hypothetical protein